MGRDTRSGVHGDPRHLAVDELALARVEAGANIDAELPNAVDDRPRAADRPRRAVEGSEEAVSRGVDLAAARACELPADDGVVALEQFSPAAVAQLGHAG